jgi:hypothetical protein
VRGPKPGPLHLMQQATHLQLHGDMSQAQADGRLQCARRTGRHALYSCIVHATCETWQSFANARRRSPVTAAPETVLGDAAIGLVMCMAASRSLLSCFSVCKRPLAFSALSLRDEFQQGLAGCCGRLECNAGPASHLQHLTHALCLYCSLAQWPGRHCLTCGVDLDMQLCSFRPLSFQHLFSQGISCKN